MGGSTPTFYTGEDATIEIIDVAGTGKTHSTLAISDFSLTISRGTSEQELLGEKGNFMLAGSRSVEASLTSCKLTQAGIGTIVSGMIGGKSVQVSGNCGANSLHWYFRSCQVTGFDFSIGTADEISEGSIDFAILHPYMVSGVQHKSAAGGTYISDWERY